MGWFIFLKWYYNFFFKNSKVVFCDNVFLGVRITGLFYSEIILEGCFLLFELLNFFF